MDGVTPAGPVEDALTLQIADLSVLYPGASSSALEGAGLRIPVGVRAALLGANGSSKSTLLKAVDGLLPVLTEEIRV